MRFIEEYQSKVAYLNDWKNEVEKRVTDILKYHTKRPLFIGNMVYDVTTMNGREVAGYAYQTDYKEKGSKALRPIWDRNETLCFGWVDFNDCCRIYDLICNTIMEKKV